MTFDLPSDYKPKIHVDRIAINPPGRPIDFWHMIRIAGSMLMEGQKTPVLLSNLPKRNYLIDGRHRLMAAKWLGWEYIEYVSVNNEVHY